MITHELSQDNHTIITPSIQTEGIWRGQFSGENCEDIPGSIIKMPTFYFNMAANPLQITTSHIFLNTKIGNYFIMSY